jgi:hypothetical protein
MLRRPGILFSSSLLKMSWSLYIFFQIGKGQLCGLSKSNDVMHGEGRPSKCVYKALRRQKWQKSRAGNSGDRPPERVGEKVLKRKFCRLGRLEKKMQ